MSIIILAQSLKNDGTADIQIDGVFSPPPEKSQQLNAFYKNCRTIEFKKSGNCGLEFGIEPKFSLNPIYGFTINCEEKDNLGRNSPICIQANLIEMHNIVQHLEKFLQSSGRNISEIKMKSIKRKIHFERETLKFLIKCLLLKIFN